MSDYLAVIAIDFGTTFTGYAYSMLSSKHDIRMNKNWGADVGFQSYKTPTTLMLNSDGDLSAFGFEAESKFSELDDGELKQGYLLFQRFKMELYGNKKLDSKIRIKSTSGAEKQAIKIVSLALAFVKDHSQKAISKSLGRPIESKYIRWVITVPAIWSDTAKKFMRLAASQVRLVDDILSQNLIIALEPEAASLYCRTLTLDKYVGKDEGTNPLSIEAGDRYIIVDCGGGTVDIAVHELEAEGNVKEIACASGGPWGGINVDKKFFQLCDDLFGSDFMNRLKRFHSSIWLSLLVEFETKKRGAQPGANGLAIFISMEFADVFKEYSGLNLKDHMKSKNNPGVKFRNGMLRISEDSIRSLYTDLLDNIGAHLRQLLHKVQDASKMFVVGGFAESAYIQDYLMSTFQSDVDILIPEDAGMCVMKGAVLFGHDTHAITSRIARFNYGVRLLRDRKLDDDKNRETTQNDYGTRVKYIQRLVNRGQIMRNDETVEHKCRISRADKTFFHLPLYSIEDDDSDDCNHPTARLLETLQVDSPNAEKGLDRKCKILLRFGGTELLFKAIDLASENEASTIVSF